MDTKYTCWFPASKLPVRVGVYQRKYPLGKTELVRFSYWDGKLWYVAGNVPRDAESAYESNDTAPRQKLSWRGSMNHD
jgi:hypothetical protein